MVSRRILLQLVSLLPFSVPILSAKARAQQSTVDYSLQDGVDGLSIPEAVTVVGCGGFGCWPALFSALAGVRKLLIVDAGNVAPDDLQRTIYRPSDIGRPKAEALSEIIGIFRPDVEITAQKRFVKPGDDDIFFGSVLFNGTDYKPLSSYLPKAARDRNMRFVHAYYFGAAIAVSGHFPKGMEYTRGSVTPVWPGSAALAGLFAINSAYIASINFAGTPESLNMSVEDFEALRPRDGGA